MARKSALLVVDVQNDFLPGGALGVPNGDEVVPVLNRYMEMFSAAGLPVYTSRDWHPPVTKHFKEHGGIWPPHCVQDTWGAEFHTGLRRPEGAIIVSKGMDPERDSYSAFDAIEEDGTPLAESLRGRGVDHIYIGGLATDYCVKWSAMEAANQGFDFTTLIDACLGVNLEPHDSERAIAEMVRAGAKVVVLEQVELT